MRFLNRLFALLTFAPLGLWLLASAAVLALDHGLGCAINAAAASPCVLAGLDLSEPAYTLGLFAAWGPLLIGPICLGAGILWLLVAMIASIRKRTR